jgi:predicted HicB family RNase H-like nuclease
MPSTRTTHYPLNLRIGAGLMDRINSAAIARDEYRIDWMITTISDAVVKGLKPKITIDDLRDINNGKKLTQIEIPKTLHAKAKKKAAKAKLDLTTWISIACAQRAKA